MCLRKLKGSKYCYTTPTNLSNCHWVERSSGQDCVNTKYTSTKLIVDCASYDESGDANNNESFVSYHKRDELNVLKKRSARKTYTIVAADVTIEILAVIYPPIEDLFKIAQVAQIQK
ncbi:unnamed protein product [Penicillium salamii]|uniref:Uncharacterized protein n=1 Tax=Penicillium salamii TaxID=1612424 RepID=A0A9W4IAP9_9EURO|nr:unnamed protein product [Penicillium salamii]